jgi:uncharacterized phage-associated protein
MERSAFRLIPYILRRIHDTGQTVDPLKLQKLLYYIQAWSLVIRGQPIYLEPLEAWVHGPVVPPVYRHYRCHGYRSILLSDDPPGRPEDDDVSSLNPDEVAVIDLICETYGKKTGAFLEELTHSENPWIQARSGLKGLQRSNRKISLKEMMHYYSQFLQSRQPPLIKTKAFQIHKKGASSHLSAFLVGMGSTLNLMPQPRRGRTFFVHADFADPISDLEALEADWSAVGSSLEQAIHSVGIHG